MGYVQQTIEECLLKGFDTHTARIIDVDTFDEATWRSFLDQADQNASNALELIIQFQGPTLFNALGRVLSGTVHNVKVIFPGAIRVGIALFFGKVLTPKGKHEQRLHQWWTHDSVVRSADLCASMLFDASERVRHTAIKSLAIGAHSQPHAVHLARAELLKPLSCYPNDSNNMTANKSAHIREDGIRAAQACISILHRNVLLTIAAMLVDEEDLVRRASRKMLFEVVQQESGVRQNELLDGLVKGWFPDEDSGDVENNEDDALRAQDGQFADDEIDARSVLLLLTGQQKPPFALNLEQSLNVRGALASILPRGYPAAIRAALRLAESGGGEGEAEEAEDLRAVAAAAATFAIIGPGQDTQGVIAFICERMRSKDAPLTHLPPLASALGTQFTCFTGTSVQTLMQKTLRCY